MNRGRRLARLSSVDHMLLVTEKPRAPQHIGGLCIVDATPLLAADATLDLATIKHRLERRLLRTPELRRKVRRTFPPLGRPVWVDDAHFSIDRHVRATSVAPPGDEASVLATAERLLRPLLDRSRPLWELWFLTGLEGGRLGVLFKVHHAVADGLAAVALIASLFDVEPDTPDPAATAWMPSPTPTAWQLFTDNLSGRLAPLGSVLAHPIVKGRAVASTLATTVRLLPETSAAPRTSLNQALQEERHLGAIHLDLEAARAVAHRRGGKINDVVLDIVAGGVRELLLTRGELESALEVIAAVPVSMRTSELARELGNAVGVFSIRLPLGESDDRRRLDLIVRRSAMAKAQQHVINRANQLGMAFFGWLDVVGLHILDRQRMINFMVSNVAGPTEPLYVLGARIENVVPFLPLFGNETLTFVALSYCGRLTLAFVADRTACADVDALVRGMRRSWQDLSTVAPAA